MDYRFIAGGVAGFAAQFAGLWGGEGGDSSELLHLQMLMLQNISGKLDALKKELDLIVESILSLQLAVDQLPAHTAAQIYKVDLQGRILDIEELIGAYRDESRSGSSPGIQKLVDFIGRSYVEFRSARNRLFFLFPDTPKEEDFLVIPIAALCLHYETVCLLLTGQPESLRRVTFQSYANYFGKWLGGPGQLNKTLQDLINEQRQVTGDLRSALVYGKCTTQVRDGGGEGIPPSTSYTARLRRFKQEMTPLADDADVRQAQDLVDRHLLNADDLPAAVNVNPVGTVMTIDFTVSNGPTPADKIVEMNAPIQFDDGTVIPETRRALMHATACVQGQDIVAPPNPGLDAIRTSRDDRGRKLICLASMADIARRAVAAVADLNSGSTARPGLSPFGSDVGYLLELLGHRSTTWAKLLADKAATLEQVRRDHLNEIGATWTALQQDAQRIAAQYKDAEERLREANQPDLLRAGSELLAPLARAATEALASVDAAQRQLVHDVEWNLKKAVEDVGAEVGRAGENIEVAFSLIFDFIEAENSNFLHTLDQAAKNMRKGRIVDAVWDLSLGRLKGTEDNLGTAVMKSSLLKDLAMAAASIYGGPVGTAAFTAWYTYKATGGDLNSALKAGLIAGLSAQGMALSSEIPYTELTRRTLASAVVGAAAVAAAGGNEKDIIQGFLTGTALTLASAYYNSQGGRDMDGRLATEAPIDKFDTKNQEYYGVFCDEDGHPVLTFNEQTQSFEPRIDTNNIPARISQVGIASREALGGIADMVSSESAIPMRALAGGIPMMNAMASLHDHLCDLYALQNTAVVALTIIPASILTVAASETPLDGLLLATLNSADAQNKLRRDDSGYLVLPGKLAEPEPQPARA